jgi:hypothetical protein
MTGKQTKWTEDDLLNGVVQAFDSGGIGAAVALLESVEDPILAARAFDEMSRKLYHARRDVTNMIAVAEAGVAFCLDRAGRTKDADKAKTLSTTAKTIAFNAGANCWPGWGDDGIEIGPAHILSGLELATVSRGLVRELQLGRRQEATGTWLIGALKLAAGDPAAALEDFEDVRSSAQSRGDTVHALMAAGYCGLARKAQPATASAGIRELEFAVARLNELNLKEATFFARQLVTADKTLFANDRDGR